ncbi:protease modulator HflC [soil metagenome]
MASRLFRYLASALTIGLMVVALVRAWVVVDETQFVLVTSFGRPVALYGDDEAETGLQWKWPWQGTWTIDRRVQVFDPPPREVITGDKQNLEVAAYVVWRVVDPEAFLRAAGLMEAARDRLEERVSAALSNAIGRQELAALASIDPDAWQLDRLTEEVRFEVAEAARTELGVEVMDVGLRRFNHPLEVRPAVFDLIRSERQQVAATLRAEGELNYRAITSKADRERDALLAQADAEAERVRGQGEAEATRILNEAHALDPRFYEFLRTLEAYRSLLDDRSTIVLSSGSPLLRLLTEGPSEELLKGDKPDSSTSAGPPVARQDQEQDQEAAVVDVPASETCP